MDGSAWEPSDRLIRVKEIKEYQHNHRWRFKKEKSEANKLHHTKVCKYSSKVVWTSGVCSLFPLQIYIFPWPIFHLNFWKFWSAKTNLKIEQSNSFCIICMPAVWVYAFMCVYVYTEVYEGSKNSMFTYLGVAPGPWAAVPCWEAPGGGLRKVIQVGQASCPASGAVSSSFPPAPFGSCRSFLPADGSTPPKRRCSRREEGCYKVKLNSA